MTRRQQQAAETRQLIIDETKHLLKEKEYSELTVRDIASACGIAVGTFYGHFESKEALGIEILYERVDRFAENLLVNEELNFRPRITSWIHLFLQQLCQDNSPKLLQNLLTFRLTGAYREVRDKGGRNKPGYERHHDYVCIHRIFCRAIADGELKADAPVEWLARLTVYGVYGAYLQAALWGEIDIMERWMKEHSERLFSDVFTPWLIEK